MNVVIFILIVLIVMALLLYAVELIPLPPSPTYVKRLLQALVQGQRRPPHFSAITSSGDTKAPGKRSSAQDGRTRRSPFRIAYVTGIISAP